MSKEYVLGLSVDDYIENVQIVQEVYLSPRLYMTTIEELISWYFSVLNIQAVRSVFFKIILSVFIYYLCNRANRNLYKLQRAVYNYSGARNQPATASLYGTTTY